LKISIIGAGYAGLALAIALKELDPKLSITIFHRDPISASASSISTGLLHPLAGKFARKSFAAEEGFNQTKGLLDLSEKMLGQTVCQKGGMVRVANYPYQIGNYKRASRKHPINTWHEDGKAFHPDLDYPLLFSPEAITVYSDLYVEGLKIACEKLGVSFKKQEVKSTDELAFDRVVLCSGAGIVEFAEGKDLPVEKIKGQALILKYPKGFTPFPMSLLSKGHISLCKDPNYCQIGSTYEKNYSSPAPDENANTLVELIEQFFPRIKEFEVVGAKAGIRLSRIESYLPIVAPMSKKVWVFGALGSRGLIYHAYLADLLAKAMLFDQEIPERFTLAQNYCF